MAIVSSSEITLTRVDDGQDGTDGADGYSPQVTITPHQSVPAAADDVDIIDINVTMKDSSTGTVTTTTTPIKKADRIYEGLVNLSVFNQLTNGGQLQGLFVSEDNHAYFNGTYLRAEGADIGGFTIGPDSLFAESDYTIPIEWDENWQVITTENITEYTLMSSHVDWFDEDKPVSCQQRDLYEYDSPATPAFAAGIPGIAIYDSVTDTTSNAIGDPNRAKAKIMHDGSIFAGIYTRDSSKQHYSPVAWDDEGIENPNPSTLGLYELNGTSYTHTNDTSVVSGKRYYYKVYPDYGYNFKVDVRHETVTIGNKGHNIEFKSVDTTWPDAYYKDDALVLDGNYPLILSAAVEVYGPLYVNDNELTIGSATNIISDNTDVFLNSSLKMSSRASAGSALITKDVLYAYNGLDEGIGVLLQGNGTTVVAAGEAGRNLIKANVNNAQAGNGEQLHLASDSYIYFYSNCQTIANRKQMTFDTNGNLTVPGRVKHADPDALTSFGTYSAANTTVTLTSAYTNYNFLILRFGANNGDNSSMAGISTMIIPTSMINASNEFQHGWYHGSTWQNMKFQFPTTTSLKILTRVGSATGLRQVLAF